MSSEKAILVQGISKCYNIYANPIDRLKQSFYPRAAVLAGKLGGQSLAGSLQGKQRYSEFWALRDVTFDINRGETVGVVGKNGSGKSTLLQMIAGTLTPTSGDISVRGRIAALLELGSGFNPDFTGMENIRFNAAVLGLTPAEIDSRMDAIIEFADIGEFLHRPVKTYSSGMIVRLAFAVQAQVEPDILIVDEALAVGDAKFQSKCFARLDALKEAGTSILFVSHSTEQIVSHCDRAILLHEGEVKQQGRPKDVVHTYLELLFGGNRVVRSIAIETEPAQDDSEPPTVVGAEKAETSGNAFASRPNYNPYEFRWGDGAAQINDFRLIGPNGAYPTTVECGAALRLVLGVSFNQNVSRPIFGLTVKTKDGITVYGTNSEMISTEAGSQVSGRAGTGCQVVFAFDCLLGPGDYFLSVGVASRDGEDVAPHDRRYDSIHLNVLGTGFFGMAMLNVNLQANE